MKLGLDIDGTLCDYAHGLTAITSQMYGHIPQWDRYSLGLDDERYLAANDVMIRINVYLGLAPYMDAAETVQEWAKTNEITYITRRRSGSRDPHLDAKLRDQTLQWLKMHRFPNWWNVEFTQDKLTYCHEQNIPCLVEDYLHDAKKFYGLTRSNESMYCILVDRPWNQGEHHTRVLTLKEAAQHFRR